MLHLMDYMVAWTNSEKIGSYCSEGFLCRTTARTRRNHLQNIKPYGLGQGPALPNDNMIPFLDTEAG